MSEYNSNLSFRVIPWPFPVSTVHLSVTINYLVSPIYTCLPQSLVVFCLDSGLFLSFYLFPLPPFRNTFLSTQDLNQHFLSLLHIFYDPVYMFIFPYWNWVLFFWSLPFWWLVSKLDCLYSMEFYRYLHLPRLLELYSFSRSFNSECAKLKRRTKHRTYERRVGPQTTNVFLGREYRSAASTTHPPSRCCKGVARPTFSFPLNPDPDPDQLGSVSSLGKL